MLILTGMHRSGTSLAARLMQRAGADLGDPAGFYPPDRWNPDGYFEQMDVRTLNCRLLHGPLGRLAYLHLPSEETMHHRARRFAAAFGEIDRRYSGKLVKDPRFTVTAPIWSRHNLNIEKFVVCIREPSEVAESLRRRNWITRRLGLSLWEEHHRRLRDFVRGRDVWWIRYSHLLDEKANIAEIGGAARFLGLPFDENRDRDWVRAIIRTRATDPRTSERRYSASLATLWSEFCDRHQRQGSP